MWQNKADEILGKKGLSEEKEKDNNILKEDDNTTIQETKKRE